MSRPGSATSLMLPTLTSNMHEHNFTTILAKILFKFLSLFHDFAATVHARTACGQRIASRRYQLSSMFVFILKSCLITRFCEVMWVGNLHSEVISRCVVFSGLMVLLSCLVCAL